MDLYQWAVAGLDLDGKTILDAATGAGEATLVWAEYIHKHNMDAKIISVDIEQPQEWIDKIRGELGELQETGSSSTGAGCQGEHLRRRFYAPRPICLKVC